MACMRTSKLLFPLLIAAWQCSIASAQLQLAGPTPLRKDTSIAVIGAGAAGLTAAYTLETSGYTKVTVFESEPRVGGKIYSPIINGTVFDAGCVWSTSEFVRNLAASFVLQFIPEDMEFLVLPFENSTTPLTYDEFRTGMGLSFSTLGSWLRMEDRYSYLLTPTGIQYATPELFAPFEDFAASNNITALADVFRPLYAGWGYGYYNEVPAVYVMQLMLRVFNSSRLAPAPAPASGAPSGPGVNLYWLPEGFQEVWNRVADNLTDVRLSAGVERITRVEGASPGSVFAAPAAEELGGGVSTGTALAAEPDTLGPIEIVYGGGQREFYDLVIVSADLKTSLNFLDASPEEEDLFSRITHYNYITHITDSTPTLAGNSSNAFIMLNENGNDTGRVTSTYNRARSPEIWTTGQMFPENETTAMVPADLLTPPRVKSPAPVDEILAADVALLGGTIDSVLLQTPWNYFPHVLQDDLNEGWYVRFADLQGQRGTYYVGGIANFETVVTVCDFVIELVNNITQGLI